jgi:kinesin family protein 1
MAGDSVVVAVRVRPFNKREKELGSTNIVTMDGATHSTSLKDPASGTVKQFTFDYSYDSFVSPSDPNFCSQVRVWDEIGVRVLESAYEGFNVSLFAYGQTGAGKSYSMMGYPAFPVSETSGIIPIMCKEVFTKMDSLKGDDNLAIKVECSMLEIYMEKVKDLLDASGHSKPLRVRSHPKKGAYVQGLKKFTVTTFEQVNQFMEIGQQQRTVAATQMNQTSSRAHTIFTLELTQTITNVSTQKVSDKTSTISLIDLAGSERQGSTGATGQ